MQSNNSPVIPDNPVTALSFQAGEGYQTLLAPFWGGWGGDGGGAQGTYCHEKSGNKKKNQREKGYALINRLTGSFKLKVSVCYYGHACIPRR